MPWTEMFREILALYFSGIPTQTLWKLCRSGAGTTPLLFPALLIFLVYLFPFLDTSCLCWFTADGASHRDNRKVAVAGFVVSTTGVAGFLPASSPVPEDGKSSGLNLYRKSSLKKDKSSEKISFLWGAFFCVFWSPVSYYLKVMTGSVPDFPFPKTVLLV